MGSLSFGLSIRPLAIFSMTILFSLKGAFWPTTGSHTVFDHKIILVGRQLFFFIFNVSTEDFFLSADECENNLHSTK